MKTLEQVRQEMLAKAMGKPLSKYSLKDSNGKIAVSSNAPSQHAFTDPKDEAYAQNHYKLSEKFKRDDGTIINFWKLEPSPSGYFQSADGNYYLSAELPELDDEFVKRYYEKEVRGERNARISDTDDYVKLPDITVARSAGAKRSALEDADRVALETYRQALRNLPEAEGFPFVEWPEFPSALAYELQQKVDARQSMRQGGF
ncbi:phage tail assembly chaperone [Parasutterella excrementihominis]|uniref:phage tail assembly chaperone n=1 Tax=Parasutterella excrementihominis TaxID=487175 RepID=UPI00242B4B64|nr:phage tail assembly chaperone [Parasutterella excrementihominis]